MVIDVHVHIGEELDSVNGRPRYLYEATNGDQCIAMLDANGIDKALVFAPLWGGLIDDPTYARTNTVVGEAARRYPERLFFCARVNPHFGQAALDELERCRAEFALRGIKLHPDWEAFLPNDQQRMFPIAEFAQRHHLVLVFHCGMGDYYASSQPTWFYELAEAFPSVPIILLHTGLRLAHDAIRLAKQHPNVYLEGSAQQVRRIYQAIREVGVQQVVFGSDAPYNVPASEVTKITHLPGLSEAEKAQILSGNMERLLGITRPALATRP